jgi:DNA polymerase-1
MVPPDATKKSHPAERQTCKALFLGVGYGMGPPTLAKSIKQPVEKARQLILQHRATFHRFWAWNDNVVDVALLSGDLVSPMGWRRRWPRGCEAERIRHGKDDRPIMRENPARNFLMQSTGADLMRLTVTLACEAGLGVCAPVHDGFLIEARDESLDHDVALFRQIMGDASESLLGRGYRIRTDVKTVHHPDHLDEEGGVEMFRQIMTWVEEAEEAAENHARPTKDGA